MAAVLVIDCPVPPSANRLWRVGKGRIYKDARHTAWFKSFWYQWQTTKPKDFQKIEGPFDCELLICPRYPRDADNSAKAVLDAAQKLGIIGNDKQARKVTQELVGKDRAPMGAQLRITPLG